VWSDAVQIHERLELFLVDRATRLEVVSRILKDRAERRFRKVPEKLKRQSLPLLLNLLGAPGSEEMTGPRLTFC
jgi:hypothetical protein